MVVEDVPSVDEFDREDLELSPEMHQAQAEMAAERGEEYDPEEFEQRIIARRDEWPHPIEDAEPVEGMEEEFEEWKNAGDDT